MKKYLSVFASLFLSSFSLLAQAPATQQAELGAAGLEWLTLPDASTAIYVTPATNGAGQNPGSSNRVITYTVTFPQAGTYDLFVRIRVNAAGANDDSFFYGNGFGTKSPTNDNDWITANGLFSFGYTTPSDVVESTGQAATGVWKWLNLSEYNGGEPPITFVVAPGSLTQTFQIGAREDGLDIDKLVFGLSNHYYTVANLDNGQPGSTTPPPPPFVPQGPPIAKGKEKFLGCAYSNQQKVNFGKYWNQVVAENAGKWGSVEPFRDVMNWAELDSSYKLAKDSGYVYRFHVLVWGNQQPSWIENLPPAEQLEEIREWFTAVAQRYPAIDFLEVVNEPVNDPPSSAGSGGGNYINALGGSGTTGWDWIIKAFEMAREIFPPTTKLMINEYNLENVGNVRSQYLTIVNLLKQRNLIDAVGTQAHAFSTRGSSAGITASLNELAATGLPLYATELDIDDRIPPSTTGSDEVQLQEYQRIFPLYWQHPAVRGITLWGYRPGHWRTDQGAFLAHSNGAERSALVWLRSYVSGTNATLPVSLAFFEAVRKQNVVHLSWKSSNEINNAFYVVEKSSDGLVFTSLLQVKAKDTPGAQLYDAVDATPIQGKNYYRLVQSDTDGRKTIFATRLVEISGGAVPFQVNVYPNPASSQLVIRLEGAAAEKYFVTVNDASGRIVKSFVMPPSAVQTLSVTDLSKGSYFIRVEANGNVKTVPLVISR